MGAAPILAPDATAVRVALWRALHLRVDAPPHLCVDDLGLQLAGPDQGWTQRADMQVHATMGFRAGIVARTRLVEDLVLAEAGRGIQQYVILVLAWTPSRSALHRTCRVCRSSKWTDQARRNGSDSA